MADLGDIVPTEDLPQQNSQPDSQSDDLVPQEDLPQSQIQGESVPQEDLPNEIKYNTPEQQIKAGAEGLSQGVLGPLAPFLETKVLGVKPEDIAGRQQENPVIHAVGEGTGLIGSSLTGVGEAGLIAHLIPEFASLGKIGSMALKGALESAAIQGGDEASKYLTGQVDPEHAVSSALSHMGAAGLFGAGSGALFGVIGSGMNKGFETLENSKIGNRANSFLAGYGAASRGQSAEDLNQFIDAGMEDLDKKSLKMGHDFYTKGADQIGKIAADKATDAAGIAVGNAIGGPLSGYGGYKIAQKLEPIMESIIGKPISAAAKRTVMPLLNKALVSDSPSNLGQIFSYGMKVHKGAQAMNAALDDLFRTGGQQVINSADEKNKQKIMDYIDNSGLQKEYENSLTQPTQNFAKGGEVKVIEHKNDFSNQFPDQNMMLSAAKGRVYTYLNSLKPRPQSKLPFDHEPDDKDKKKNYNRAVGLASNPLSILRHVKTGKIGQQDIQHFTSMWPELSNTLNKGITERITKDQLKGNKPPYKLRQSLSMLMGTPLDSTMVPTSIQAAQMVFAPKAPPQAPLKKGTSKLGSKSNALYNTPDQDAEVDRSKRD